MAYDNEREEGHAGAGSFVLGLLMGAAVGAGLALLMASRTGRQLREDLAERARKARQSADESYRHGRERVDHLVDRGREAYDKARGVAQRTKADIEQNVDELVGSGAGRDT